MTKSGSPSYHGTDYFFHFEGKFCGLHCIFCVPFSTCYYGRLWVHRVAQHLEQSCFTEFKFPQQVILLIASASLMKCILPRLLRI